MIRNKKAAIGATLIWIIATLIIFFIMIFYLFFVGIISVGSDKSEIGISESEEGLYVFEGFFSFLNTEVEYKGMMIDIEDAIVNSIEKYNSIENTDGEGLLDKYGIEVFDENLDSLNRKMLVQGFDESDYNQYIAFRSEDQDVELVPLIVRELNNYCNEFYLSIPQGLVTREGLKVREAEGIIFTDRWIRNNEFTSVIKHIIVIDNNIYELKFRRLRSC